MFIPRADLQKDGACAGGAAAVVSVVGEARGMIELLL